MNLNPLGKLRKVAFALTLSQCLCLLATTALANDCWTLFQNGPRAEKFNYTRTSAELYKHTRSKPLDLSEELTVVAVLPTTTDAYRNVYGEGKAPSKRHIDKMKGNYKSLTTGNPSARILSSELDGAATLKTAVLESKGKLVLITGHIDKNGVLPLPNGEKIDFISFSNFAADKGKYVIVITCNSACLMPYLKEGVSRDYITVDSGIKSALRFSKIYNKLDRKKEYIVGDLELVLEQSLGGTVKFDFKKGKTPGTMETKSATKNEPQTEKTTVQTGEGDITIFQADIIPPNVNADNANGFVLIVRLCDPTEPLCQRV